MRPILFTFAALGLLAAPLPLSAQDAENDKVAEAQDIKGESEPAKAVETADKVEGEKLICKNLAVTGTRFKERFCRTATEWEQIRSDMKETAQEMRRDGARRVEQVDLGGETSGPTADPQ